jgi:hypothetical protein
MFSKDAGALLRALHRYIPAALNLATARGGVASPARGVDLNARFPEHISCLCINGVLAGSDEAKPGRQARIDFDTGGQRQFREFDGVTQEGELS